MTGRELSDALEEAGFVVRRRSTSFVWMARGDQVLMIDLEARIPEGYAARILGVTLVPPESGVARSASSALGSFPRAMPKA
jgi:hypothetical protein